jgi:Tfp pilus assembly protein PilO
MDVIDQHTRRFGRLLHYAGVLVTVVCATAAYSLLHVPAKEAITDTSARIDELTQSVKNAPFIREQHKKISDKLLEVTTRIENIRRRVPRDVESGEFLSEVSKLAKEHQLAIKSFEPGKPENKDGYAEMQVMLKGSGNYASICAFVDELAKLTRLSKVKDLTLSAGDSAAEYPMSATLVIYFGLRGKEDPAAGEGRRG